jgi:hypothetical protein
LSSGTVFKVLDTSDYKDCCPGNVVSEPLPREGPDSFCGPPEQRRVFLLVK